MANVDDTNVLFRTDYASLEYVKQCASSVLLLGGAETPEGINELVRLNEDFIKRNISPGGCADLLLHDAVSLAPGAYYEKYGN